MNFEKINITDYTISITNIDWTYKAGQFDNGNNFEVKISLASSSNGPFQEIVTLPFYTTNYQYQSDSKRWVSYFFKLELIEYRTGLITDSRVISSLIISDPIVKKLNNKYKIMLNRVNNPIVVFKRKKIGLHCRECWDSITRRVVKSNCDTCYETGYGNNSILGLESLQLDGVLKINKDGYLEFYKRHYSFNYYEIKNEEAKIVENDEFIIYQGEQIIFRSRILEVKGDRLILNSKDESIVNNLHNASFSVYHEQDTAIDSVKLDWKLISLGGHKYELFGNINPVTELLTINSNIYTVLERNVNSTTIQGIEDIDTIGEVIETTINDEFINKYIVKYFCIYFPDTKFIKTNLQEVGDGSSFYMEYVYNGIRDFTINSKIKRLSNNNIPEKSLALYQLIDGYLHLQTLSNYENCETNDEFLLVYKNIFIKDIYFTAKDRKPALVLEIYRKRISGYNNKFVLPHKNIRKDVFRGCGVLLVNTNTAQTYRGQNWTDEGFDITDKDFDFYVNPYTGEFDSLKLPDGFYEIRYVYSMDKIKFDNYFLPINPIYENGILIDLDHWIFTHPNLIDSNISDNSILAVGTNPYYKELEIDSYNPLSGMLKLKKGVMDYDSFWGQIGDESFFSVDYKHTGGYFNGQNSLIVFLAVQPKTDYLTDFGNKNINEPVAIMNADVILDPGDLVYDTINSNFYSVSIVNSTAKRGQPVYQKIQLHEMPYFFQNKLKKLLNK